MFFSSTVPRRATSKPAAPRQSIGPGGHYGNSSVMGSDYLDSQSYRPTQAKDSYGYSRQTVAQQHQTLPQSHYTTTASSSYQQPIHPGTIRRNLGAGSTNSSAHMASTSQQQFQSSGGRAPEIRQALPAARTNFSDFSARLMPMTNTSDSGLDSIRPTRNREASMREPQAEIVPSFPSIERQSTTPVTSMSRRCMRSGDVGLDNLGNTCFMNSTLQCVMRVSTLLDLLMSGDILQDINRSKKTRGAITDSLLRTAQKVFSMDGGSVSPHEFRQAVTSWARSFSNYHQHDAQEFLRFLLDGLHEELNRVQSPPPYQELKDIVGETARAQAQRWSRYHEERNSSVITDIFGGMLQSDRTCRVCGTVSRSFDPFLDLSVPIKKTGSRCTLADCFALFTATETLAGSERAHCSQCKKATDSTIRLCVYKLPQVLVVHLKRFSGSSEGFRSKITDDVHFAETFDMSPFVSRDALTAQAPQYTLTGFINHTGYSGGGHYTAIVRSPTTKEWCDYNDSHVSPNPRISYSQAYVLFYENAMRTHSSL